MLPLPGYEDYLQRFYGSHSEGGKNRYRNVALLYKTLFVNF